MLADNTIETALSMDFLPLLNPDYFRVATPELSAAGGENSSSAQLGYICSGQKAPKSYEFLIPGWYSVPLQELG